MARVFYQQGEFEKSADIYMNFLLRSNPVTPSDYMEAAWNFYRLKRYDEALGILYNMESKAAQHLIFMEKYIIRALIARDYCDTETTEALLESFEAEFGAVIEGIKTGEPLKSFPLLQKVELADTLEYRQVVKTIEELEIERKKIPDLDSDLRELVNYLYDSELKMLSKERSLREASALDTLANHLIILGESLRFLKFDVAREKYSTDRVFKEVLPASKILVDDLDEKLFRVHWTQMGDYWRDERLVYKSLVKNRCDEEDQVNEVAKDQKSTESPKEGSSEESQISDDLLE